MFKLLAITLGLLLVASNAMSLRHEQAAKGKISFIAELSEEDQIKNAADKFFREKIPNIKNAELANSDYSGDELKFQYMNQNAPLTITEVVGQVVDK